MSTDRDRHIARAMQTRSFQKAEDELRYVAVALIGTMDMVPGPYGANDQRCPCYIKCTRNPKDAHKDSDRHSPLYPVHTLRYVWTKSEAHAKRLREAIIRCIVGDNPDETKLRHGWLDWPTWEIGWEIILKNALDDIRRRGEMVEVFSEDLRIQRTIRHAREQVGA